MKRELFKKLRDRIKNKTQGRCAYCGGELPSKVWHIDHIEPIFRGWEKRPDRAGDDVEENMIASCRRCNLWKKTFTVEQFRTEIAEQAERLRRDIAPFRLAEDFGVVKCVEQPVQFYFEYSNDMVNLSGRSTR